MTAKVIAMPSAVPRLDGFGSAASGPRSRLERGLGLIATLRPGEGTCVLLFFSYAFLLLVCYYTLKLLREPLLLVGGSAELKSYAQATIALALMLLVPLYGALFRRTAPARLVRLVTAVFAASLGAFYWLGRMGFDVGFAYYVWVGVFGVTMLAQFWAHAAHSFDVMSGQRLFPIIMAGATFGGLATPPLVGVLFPLLGPWNLMLLALVLLAATSSLVAATRRAVPAASRNRCADVAHSAKSLWSGFGLVARDRYLLLLAALIVLLNCVNTTGEYLLTDLVLRHTDAELAALPGQDAGDIIAAFYSDYYFAVNALAAVLQVLVVGRVFRWLGVHGAILVLPVIAALGYGLLVFVPVFGLIRLVKIVENSIDYSIMNTGRHALYLPLPAAQQYQGKTAIDGFFWRLGDLVQAAVIYVGLNWLGFESGQFALLNLAFALGWIAIALRVGRHYRQRAALPPRVVRRRVRSRVAATAIGVAAVAAASAANAAAVDDALREPTATEAPSGAVATGIEPLFGTDSALEIEILFDETSLCRNPQREGCEDAPATLVYHAPDGRAQSLAVTLRARGRWRKDTADCRLPALFVFFADAAGTPFAGEKMLPLTTHCREGARYEQYVLKEYIAYRILNLLTDKSLRVRLARITYRDAGEPEHSTPRYGFFTEHFDSLAARHGAEVWRPEALDLRRVNPDELATVALFEFLIGNTDWSAVYGHNVVAIREAESAVSAVPYDFDFSGFVDAEYAGPPPGLPIRDVRQRLFRGVCTPRPDWDAVFAAFAARRAGILALVADFPGLEAQHRARALAYLEAFFAVIASPERRTASVVAACRR